MTLELDIHLVIDKSKPPWVAFDIRDADDPIGERFSTDFIIPSIRPAALPALVEELVFLLMRHSPETGAHFLRRVEAGASLVEPVRLF